MDQQHLQPRVQPWMMACFGPEISADRVERGDRLLEEVFEFLQSCGYDVKRVAALRDYVWGREPGVPFQEAGGVMITLAAYCLAHELDMHAAGEAELVRIWTKVEKIRAKQAAKPTGSALPVAVEPSPLPTETARLIAVAKALADSVSFDDSGRMIGGKWQGGNGGLISRDTITKADAVRRAISAFEQEKSA
jgi:hypothetical protein